MDSENRSLINQLGQEWPIGTVAVTPWLEEHGIYQQLADRYVKTGWLERIGHGAYVRAGDSPTWTGGLFALQTCLKLPIHVAARTALELEGYGHNLVLGQGRRTYLWGAPGVRLPAWYKKFEWGVQMTYITTSLFRGTETSGLTTHFEGTPREASAWNRQPAYSGYTITTASPERGMLETCHLVPTMQSFEETRLLMEGMASLRLSLVQTLLESCRSIRAKRVFLFLADLCRHRWRGAIDDARIDLGSGKRVLVRGGRFDSKYQMTVPHDLT